MLAKRLLQVPVLSLDQDIGLHYTTNMWVQVNRCTRLRDILKMLLLNYKHFTNIIIYKIIVNRGWYSFT